MRRRELHTAAILSVPVPTNTISISTMTPTGIGDIIEKSRIQKAAGIIEMLTGKSQIPRADMYIGNIRIRIRGGLLIPITSSEFDWETAWTAATRLARSTLFGYIIEFTNYEALSVAFVLRKKKKKKRKRHEWLGIDSRHSFGIRSYDSYEALSVAFSLFVFNTMKKHKNNLHRHWTPFGTDVYELWSILLRWALFLSSMYKKAKRLAWKLDTHLVYDLRLTEA